MLYDTIIISLLFNVTLLAFLLSHLVIAMEEKSILFQDAAAVISFDSETGRVKVLHDTSILVTGDKIASIFSSSLKKKIPPNTEVIPSQGKIITPGFVDTHRHLWQTALKTLGSNTTLAEYFHRYSEFAVPKTLYTPEDVYLGQLTGIHESLNAGVTSILDHAHHTWSHETAGAGLEASVDSGARVWWAFAFHNLDPSPFTREAQVESFLELSRHGPQHKSKTVSFGISYDAWTLDDAASVQQIIDLANSEKVAAVTTHYLGGPWNFPNSPSLLANLGFLNTSIPIIFSHAAYLTAQDAVLLRNTNQFISITPESEFHYGHTNPMSPYIMDQSSLGVDTHFTFSADIIGQARLWLQSVRLRFFGQALHNWQIPTNNPMSVEQAFLLATRAGGLALHRDDIGILVEGAKADLVVFDGTSPNMLGWDSPVAAVMLHSNTGDIEHVLVNGEFRKRDFKLTIPEKEYTDIRARFLKSAERIQAAFKDVPLPNLVGSWPFQDGIKYTNAPTVDVVKDSENGYNAIFENPPSQERGANTHAEL
ncbi:putative chlorohydrolase family protein [Xylogone sp. PMI_703]|nr:putative chlorohydrolase family protein [Xylogone sp. PMI_703]